MPKISIIIPVYNTSKYLRRCLDSAINQTLKDIEIIIIDDCSTDNSRDIIKEYAKRDNRIRYHFFISNQGVAKARNYAIAMATGEWIGFIDSDDLVDLGYFEELYKYTENYDIVRGIRLVDKRHGKNKYGCIIPSIIRTGLLREHPKLRFPTNCKRGEDSKFKRWLYCITDKIFECPDNGIYYHYIKREGSLSNYTLPKQN